MFEFEVSDLITAALTVCTITQTRLSSFARTQELVEKSQGIQTISARLESHLVLFANAWIRAINSIILVSKHTNMICYKLKGKRRARTRMTNWLQSYSEPKSFEWQA
jgi:hypothetical protein